MASEPAQASLLSAILFLVLPVKFRHTTGYHSPALTFSAAIHLAIKCSSYCYTGSTRAFYVAHHAAQREVQIRTINRGKVDSPPRGHLNREIYIYLSSFAPEKFAGLFAVHVFGSVQMVRGYGFRIIAVGAWMVQEKHGLLRSGLRSLVKSAVSYRPGLRFQVKSAGRFRSGLHSTSSRTATSPMR